MNAQQVVDYVKASQATTESVDKTEVVGGTVGKIALDTAAYAKFYTSLKPNMI